MKITKTIDNLKDKYKDQDIYVLAAGSSMNFISKDFFDNKITVGINRTCNFFKCDYTVTKDSEAFDFILNNSVNPNNIMVVSKYRYGTRRGGGNKAVKGALYFDHFDKPGQRPQYQKISKDSNTLVVSHSTVTSGIHFAAFLGAKNIILCGHDCGTINGDSVIKGYYSKIKPHQRTMGGYNNWLKSIRQDTINVVNKLKEEYSCNIYSINPFLYFDLCGNKYN